MQKLSDIEQVTHPTNTEHKCSRVVDFIAQELAPVSFTNLINSARLGLRFKLLQVFLAMATDKSSVKLK